VRTHDVRGTAANKIALLFQPFYTNCTVALEPMRCFNVQVRLRRPELWISGNQEATILMLEWSSTATFNMAVHCCKLIE